MKVERITPTPAPPPDVIEVSMSIPEAEILRAILGATAGSPSNNFIYRLYKELGDFGVRSYHIRKTGYISIND